MAVARRQRHRCARVSARQLARAWAFGLALGCLFAFRSARADEPEPPEPDRNPNVYPRPSARPNLVLIGGVVTGVWYGGAVGMSYAWPHAPRASALKIPVAGPYMALAETGCGTHERGCGTLRVVFRTILTSLSAVGQAGGILAAVEGLFLRTKSGDRATASRDPEADRPRRPKPSVAISLGVPGSRAMGVGVSGSF